MEGKNMKNKIFGKKSAGVLLVTLVMIFSSTIVTANSIKVDATSLATDSQNVACVKQSEIIGGRDVLWDNGLPDGVNGVSCCYYAGYPLDRLIADDFDIALGAWNVNGGSFRMVANAGTGSASVLGVKVFFYQDDSLKPALTAFATPTATFTAVDTGDLYFGRPEILVTVTFDPVELTTGKWWVCFQPIINDNAFWLTSSMIGEAIYLIYPDQGFTQWTKGSVVFGSDYSVSYTLTGSAASMPKLELGEINLGLGVSTVIKNTGDAAATNVTWSISCTGGLIFPKLKDGSIASIAVDGSATIKMIVLGFGQGTFTVTATCDEGSEATGNQTGFVLLFFVLGV
jgi:hypothetical protein